MNRNNYKWILMLLILCMVWVLGCDTNDEKEPESDRGDNLMEDAAGGGTSGSDSNPGNNDDGNPFTDDSPGIEECMEMMDFYYECGAVIVYAEENLTLDQAKDLCGLAQEEAFCPLDCYIHDEDTEINCEDYFICVTNDCGKVEYDTGE